MAGNSNRKRTKKRAEEETSLWGFLFNKEEQSQDITKTAFFGQPGEEEENEEDSEAPRNILQELWRRFNTWSILACIVFFIFTLTLMKAVISMWVPQNMRDIAGYSDNGSARDLFALLSNANGQEISFTIVVKNEGECDITGVYIVDNDGNHKYYEYGRYKGGIGAVNEDSFKGN
jgi:hypothetical protein